ncbi:hypothetical protein HN446_02245 [bacterium]|nr:hypothetical protein [bacterium]
MRANFIKLNCFILFPFFVFCYSSDPDQDIVDTFAEIAVAVSLMGEPAGSDLLYSDDDEVEGVARGPQRRFTRPSVLVIPPYKGVWACRHDGEELEDERKKSSPRRRALSLDAGLGSVANGTDDAAEPFVWPDGEGLWDFLAGADDINSVAAFLPPDEGVKKETLPERLSCTGGRLAGLAKFLVGVDDKEEGPVVSFAAPAVSLAEGVFTELEPCVREPQILSLAMRLVRRSRGAVGVAEMPMHEATKEAERMILADDVPSLRPPVPVGSVIEPALFSECVDEPFEPDDNGSFVALRSKGRWICAQVKRFKSETNAFGQKVESVVVSAVPGDAVYRPFQFSFPAKGVAGLVKKIPQEFC